MKLPGNITLSFWKVVGALLMLAGLVAAVMRYSLGLGATTHLVDTFPWGIWIGVDILVGVGIAAGGFTVAATVYIFNLERFRPILRPTRGAHLVVPASRIGNRNAILFTSPVDGRVMFVLPWGEWSYIGTTDTDTLESPDSTAASSDDVVYLLRSVNAQFPNARLGTGDVRATWAGLRALIASPDGRAPSSVSREHVIVTGRGGVVTVAGGKLTTCRVMAATTARGPSNWVRRTW